MAQPHNANHCMKPLTCTKCLLAVSEKEASFQLHNVSKTNTVVCNQCYMIGRQLRNIFGTWPIQEFHFLPPSEQLAFWRSNEDKQAFVDDIIKKASEEKKLQSGRNFFYQYRPLGVWVKLGYTEEAIQKLCRDTKEHRVLGTLYGLSIEEADNQSTMASEIFRSREHATNAHTTKGHVRAKEKKLKKSNKAHKKKNKKKKKKKEKKENTKENIKRKYNTIKTSEGSTTHSSESSSAT